MRVLPSALAAVVSLLAVGSIAQEVGRNVNMVSGTRWPKGDPFLQRQNEPSMAVSTRNPQHLLAGANDYRTVDLPGLPGTGEEAMVGDAWLGLFKSFDGGQTWRSTLVPGYPQDQSAQGLLAPMKGYEAAADPTVRAGTNGLFFYSGIVFGRDDTDPGAVFVARLIDDNNAEGGDPIHYLGATLVASESKKKRFIDKPWLAVDIPRANAARCTVNGQTFPAGNVYLTYSLFVGDLTPKDPTDPTKINVRIMFSRSTDCGVTWSQPVALQERHPVAQGTSIAIDPLDGTLYVVWRQFLETTNKGLDPDSIWIARLTNGGRTFDAAVKIADIQPFDQGSSSVSFRTNSYATIAVDDVHRVHVAWAQRGIGPAAAQAVAATASVPAGDARIVVTTSKDRGLTWPAAVPIDNPPSGTAADCGPGFPNPDCRGHQIMPSLSFAAGKLMALFYDLRLDHSVTLLEPDPAKPGQTNEVREPAGGDPLDNVFTTAIREVDPSGKPLTRRHTLDVRVARAVPADQLHFDPSTRVSQYVHGNVRGPTGTIQQVKQLEFNVPNLPIFALGTTPFIGDYIDLAPAPPFVRLPGTEQWAYNTSPSAPVVMHAVWTDNRDVRPPADGRSWDKYVAPRLTGGTSLFDPNQEFVACSDTDSTHSRNTGMRNQNIYTARISEGLVVSSPQNTKPLGETIFPDGRRTLLQRAFVVQIQNATREARGFRLTIADPQPVGGRASFLQFGQEPLKALDVNIAARSTVARTLYVTSTDRHASVRVDVAELTELAKLNVHPPLKDGGLTSFIVFNADPTSPDVAPPDVTNADSTNLSEAAISLATPELTNPELTNKVLNPELTNPELTNPEITNAEVYNPELTNPELTNPELTNPELTNPELTNPELTNPELTNIRVENPELTNPELTNPELTNLEISNPELTNPELTNTALRDVVWAVTNRGNTAAAYSVRMLVRQGKLPADFKLRQMVIYKTYTTPVSLGCDLHVETQNVVLANIPLNPELTNPELTNPELTNSDITNPELTNATLSLAPGESAFVNLRISDTKPNDPVTFETVQLDEAVAPAVAPTAIATEEAEKVLEANVPPPTPAAVLPPAFGDLKISDAEVVEGNPGDAVRAVFTVALSTASDQTVTVDYATADGTARAGVGAGSDYSASSGTLTFDPGDTSKRIEVSILPDTDSEPNETFFVSLTNPHNTTLADAQGIGVIRNDDAVVSIADPAPVREGDSGQRSVDFSVTLSEPSASAVTVEYFTSDGTATAGSDYVATAGVLTFAAGETSKLVSVLVNGDTAPEPNETFFLTLVNATNTTFLKREAVAEIRNDDAPPPTLSIADLSVAEGNSGLTPAVFTVTLSAPSAQTVTVHFETADATAVAGADYRAASGDLTFPPNSRTQQITVSVFGDTLAGPDQTFFVNLSNPENAALLDGQAVGTIANDDAVGISIDDVSVVEGDAGTRTAVFTVSLPGPGNKTVSLDFATANGLAPNGAEAGSDYVAASGRLSFPIGTTTQTITVTINGDEAVEKDERFRVNLSNPSNATLTRSFAIGTIENDDFPPLPRLTINDVTVVEGDTGSTDAVFTVSLSEPSAQTVTLRFDTVHGTATAGKDYATTSGILSFLPGETQKTVGVPVIADVTSEPDETFFVRLVEDANPASLSPTNAYIGDAEGMGTIQNDDVDISVDSVSVVEGQSGTANAVFTVRLSNAADHVVTVEYSTADWTALAPGDYATQSGALLFLPGETVKTITVAVAADAVEEVDEIFYVDLANASGGRIVEPRGVGTILNDDDPALPTLSVGDVTVVEGNAGTVSATFTVQLCGSAIPGNPCPASSRTVTVEFATADGTATAGVDYETVGGRLTFAPGESRQTVTVVVFGERTFELDETLLFGLHSPNNATLGRRQATGTIQNDDPAPTLSIAGVSVTEGDAGATDAVFKVTLSAASSQTITVQAATADGSATAGSDYEATSGTLTFEPGTTSQTFAVAVMGDVVDEPNETFSVTLSNAVAAMLGTAAATGTIVDDDAAGASLSIDDVSVVEGASGTTNAVFNVTLSAAVNQTVTAGYATADGSATAGTDYVAASGTLTFPAGTTSQAITVPVNGDTLGENDEQFFVNLSAPVRATLARPQGVGTIVDDDGASAWGANESGQLGDGSTTNRGVPVGIAGLTHVAGLGGGAAHSLAVSADGRVRAWGSNSRGQLGDGSTGDHTAPVVVTGLTDAVALAGGREHSYALRADGSIWSWGAGHAGQLGRGNSADHSTAGPVDAIGTALAVASGASHGLALLADGTVHAWGDNQWGQLGDGTQNDRLTPVAVVGLTNVIAVAAGDGHSLALQGDGTVWAWGQNDGGQLGNGTTTHSAVPVRVTGLDDVRAVAAGGMTSVALRADGSVWVWGDGQTAPVRVDGFGGAIAIASGAHHRLALKADRTVWARGANDFGQLGDGTVANQTVFVPVVGLAPAASIAAGANHSLAVTAPLPSLSVSDVTISEGNTGTASAAFTVTLSAARAEPVSVRYVTADGAARAGSDYQATSGTLLFPPGTTAQTIVVPVYGDTLAESDEIFSLDLLSPLGAAITGGQGIATIVDNDPPSLSIEDLSVIEGGGAKTVTANVRLSAPSTHTVTVSFQTADGTAAAGSDYVADIGTLTFDPGVVGAAISLQVLGDAAVEPNETFFVRLSNPVGAVLENTQATVTVVNDDTATAGQAVGLIADDDPMPLLAIDDISVSEGDTAHFTVRLVRGNGQPAPSSQPVTVHFATADGTARAGTDYQPAFGTLTFAPGVTAQTVSVTVNSDATAEGEEIFFINLTSSAGARIRDEQGIGTIRP